MSICPKSPWFASLGFKKKEEIPTEDKVAETFLAINPLFPIPAAITLPLQSAISSTAFTKDLSKILLIFLSSEI